MEKSNEPSGEKEKKKKERKRNNAVNSGHHFWVEYAISSEVTHLQK